MTSPVPALGIDVCDACLRRAWIVSRLSAHLDRVRGRARDVLALGDDELLSGLAGRDADPVRAELAEVQPVALREKIAAAGQHAVCRCAPEYPTRLRELPGAPAVIFSAGGPHTRAGLLGRPGVAVVGSRGPSPYGREAALMLGRGLASAGLSVISGMAFGIDAAAHHGALQVGGPTVAVLPGEAGQPYPRAHRGLFAEICRSGTTVSELLPGSPPRRWSFSARNRIIAALAEMTVVVEARLYSGSLLTARVARELGRPVGAVPGRVNNSPAEGPHELLRAGAVLIRSVQDVLEELPACQSDADPGEALGGAVRLASTTAPSPDPLSAGAERLHGELLRGHDLDQASAAAGLDTGGALAALAELELAGYVRRGAGGAYEPRM